MIEKDVTIIGGGPGGYVAAIHAAHLGASVALIEKDTLGGTCLNRGCIPTKTLVKSAEVLQEAKRAGDFGVELDNVRVNFQKVMERKRSVVNQLVSSVERLMKLNRVSVYKGTGRLISPLVVRVNAEEIASRKMIIATGSEYTPLLVPGAYLPGVLSTDDILDLTELPKSLAVVGGSHVGAEFATIFNALGTKVTIIKRRPLRLEPVDEEIGKRFAQTLPRRGIEVITGAAVKEIKQTDGHLKVLWDTSEGEQGAEAQVVLMATGRKPFTEGLNIADISLAMNEAAVAVNEYLETNIKGVYAIGDVLGTNMLAHVASYEGIIAVENALGRKRKADYRAVPNCVFTCPVVASVGITESEAREQGIPFNVSKFPFSACGRAVVMGDMTGLVKLICHADGGRVLGMHIMGPNADDLIAEGALAIRIGATAEDLAYTIHAHPTLPEAIHETAMGQIGGSIHFGGM